MGTRAKEKGADFERKTCQRLSLWVSNLTRQDVFWRSSMSGGRATIALKKKKKASGTPTTQLGDISAIHPMGALLLDLFVVECKHYKNLMWDHNVWGMDGQIKFIWRPYQRAARATSRAPMVIAKQNFRDELVMTTEAGAEILKVGLKHLDGLPCLAIFPQERLQIYSFRDVVTHVDFGLIRAAYKDPYAPK